jgi:hypothetical protein
LACCALRAPVRNQLRLCRSVLQTRRRAVSSRKLPPQSAIPCPGELHLCMPNLATDPTPRVLLPLPGRSCAHSPSPGASGCWFQPPCWAHLLGAPPFTDLWYFAGTATTLLRRLASGWAPSSPSSPSPRWCNSCATSRRWAGHHPTTNPPPALVPLVVANL